MTGVRELNCDGLLSRTKRNRVWEVDFLRGLCIIMVIFDHMMFDFAWVIEYAWNYTEVANVFFETLQDFAWTYWNSGVRVGVRTAVIFIFLFLSGISCSFSRSNTGRLVKLSAAASAVTLVTVALEINGFTGIAIVLGILHIMAVSVLCYIPLNKLAVVAAEKFLPQNARAPARGIFILLIGGAITLIGVNIPSWQNLPLAKALGNPAVLWPFALVSIVILVYFAQKVREKRLTPKLTPSKNRIADAGFAAVAALIFILVFVLLPKDAFREAELDGFLDILLGTAMFGGDSYGIFPYTGMFLMGAAAGGLLYPNKRSLLPVLDAPLPDPVGRAAVVIYGACAGAGIGFLTGHFSNALAGTIVGTVLALSFSVLACWRDRRIRGNRAVWHAAYSFAGRNSIWIYLAHQIVVFVTIVLAAMAVGYRFF